MGVRYTRFVSLGLALVGCSGKDKDDSDDGGFSRACDQSEIDGDCVDYTGPGWAEEDVISHCTEQGFLIEGCPDSAIGWCTIDAGTDFETVTGFYTPFWTAPMAVQACQGQSGSWEAAE